MLQTIITVVVIALLVVIAIRCICIVPQANAWIVESLGKYKETWNAGLHFKVPFIDRIAKRVLLIRLLALSSLNAA